MVEFFMSRFQRTTLLLLALLCLPVWAALLYIILTLNTPEKLTILPTLAILTTTEPTRTPSLTASPTPTGMPTFLVPPTLIPTEVLPTLATQVLEIYAIMPGVFVPPTATPYPADVTVIPAPPNPYEPLPDATRLPPPYFGWTSFESDHPNVIYATRWERRLHPNASRGQYHRTGDVYSSVSFAFEGEGLRIRYVAARNMGLFHVVVEVINRWLAQNAFSPLIQMTNDTLEVAVGLAFVVALFVLGITYLLAAIIRLDVVSPRSAILWYIAGSLFFAVGPSLYQGMNDFRMTVAEGFYLSALNGLQGTVGGTFGSLSQVQSADLGIGAICDHLGVYLPGATGAGRIDGLDVALAYVRADGPDVMGYPQPFFSPGCPPHFFNPLTGAYVSSIPQEWYFPGSFFDVNQGAALSFDILTDAQRAASIAIASSSQGRLLTAWPLVLFGVVEQLVFLLITIAQGLTFISFGVAILFAFFKRTESIAHSLINQWIELIVQTTIIALIQALVIGFFLAGAATGSAAAIIGIGLICLVFIVITMWSGIKAVWNSFNRLFNAMGQVSGNVLPSPGSVTLAAVTGAALLSGTLPLKSFP
jgi:hypothetical protein